MDAVVVVGDEGSEFVVDAVDVGVEEDEDEELVVDDDDDD